MSNFDFGAQKVVLCDIDPDAIDIARTTYLENGIGDFFATPSPEEAIRQVDRLSPDIILLALNLPDTNGIEVVKKIRSMNDGAFYKTPILLLLEKVSQHMLREACRAGIEGALRKPLSSEKILRFTRAVIMKPRRFICVAHYFGPERRSRDDPHFEGIADRRGSCTPASEPSRSKAGVVLSSTPARKKETVIDHASLMGGAKSGASKEKSDFDWGESQTKAKPDGGKIDFGDLTAMPEKKSSNGNYELTGELAAKKEDKLEPVKATPKPAAPKVEPVEPEKTVAPEVEKTVEAVEEKQVEVQKTGPDSDDFAEIIDLDECLDLHKNWINSGGREGLQANRPHSDFRGQEIAEADFTQAILPQSNFEGVNCSHTVFRKADLSGSTFKDALMSSADLRVSRLARADMRNARLDQANMLGTDLSGANLEGATLRGVNLSGANLHLTNLRGVNLAMTQGLIREQIKRAITDSTTRLPTSLKVTTQ